MSGCLVALLVVGAVCALFCIIGAVGLFAAARSPEGKKAFSILGKSMKVVAKGATAPGAAELRAAGCGQAMVMDFDETLGDFAEVFDAGMNVKKGPQVGVMVMCQGTLFQQLPDCDTLAPIYVAAAHPTEGFTVIVQQQGSGKQACLKRYRPDGTAAEDLQGR